ncbi:MAG: cytochrome c family protein [bacterium]|nr:cytochrome c family protein [bacterium]
MKRWLLLISLCFWSLGADALELRVTGQILGEIRPCGCEPGQEKGGIERLATYLKEHLGKDRLWVDLGNYAVEPNPQGQLKNALFLKLFRQQRLFAMLPGPAEFSMGKRGIAKNRLPYLLTNHKGELAFTERIKHRGGWKFFGYLSPELLSQGTHKTQLLDGPQALIKRVRGLKSAEWKNLLLFRGNAAELQQLTDSGLFDQILVANQAILEEKQTFEETAGGKKWPKPPIKGQGVLRLDLGAVQQKPTIDWLDNTVANDSSWAKDFKDYDKKVEGLFMAFLESQSAKPDKRVYKGSAYCVNCHPKAGKAWADSDHSKAFSVLEAAGRQYDPDCIVCHVQGMRKGGFLSKELTPELQNVGCENCHGVVAEAHAQDAEFKKNRKPVTERVCTTCHQGSHSPKFRFETYYPKIQH